MYGISEKLFIAGLVVLFITVVLGGMYGVQLARMYIRCRAMEREYDIERRERERNARWEREAVRWFDLNDKQNARIQRLNDELTERTKELENARATLAKFNIKGEKI